MENVAPDVKENIVGELAIEANSLNPAVETASSKINVPPLKEEEINQEQNGIKNMTSSESYDSPVKEEELNKKQNEVKNEAPSKFSDSPVKEEEINQEQNGIQIGDESEGKCDDNGFTYTVFVGKLVDRVTPEELKTFFIQEAKFKEEEILNVNIPCKVVKKSKKLGIAFVDLANEQTYQAALALNNTSFLGQDLLVLPAAKTHEGLLLMDGNANERLPVKSKNASNSNHVPVYKKSDHVAYIKNLPHGVSEDEVLEFFKFSRKDVVDIAIPFLFKTKRNAKRPVRAIIAFPSEESLQKCLDQTKSKFRDREVVVERHQMVNKVTPGEKRAAPPGNVKEENELAPSSEKQVCTASTSSIKKINDKTTPTGHLEMDLFVKHIPREASDRQIKDFFSSAGATVTKVNLFSESVTGSTRGMGFVSMFNKESVKKGLLLDCKRFYKNKVRVSVRRDREHMSRIDNVELIPNFSTFVGNLPIREKAEVVKQAIFKHFQRKSCSVKDVFVPLPTNRSGNRGYAFVVFENESSLKEAQNLSNSVVKFDHGNAKITVSDKWPENPPESRAFDNKTRDGRTFEQNAAFGHEEPPGKLRKRKKGMPASGTSSYSPPTFDRPLVTRGIPDNESSNKATSWNGPPRFQSEQPEFCPLNQDPREYYLEYLEYRDYVAMRKAYDERRDLMEFQSQSRFRCDNGADEFLQQRDLSHQGGMLSSNISRQMGITTKDVQMEEDNLGTYSTFQSSGPRNPISFDSHGTRSHTHTDRDLDYVGPHRSGATSSPFAGSGNYSGVGGGRSSGGISFSENDTSCFSDNFSSINSSRYHTANSSLFRSQLLDNSQDGLNSFTFSRDSTQFRDSANGIDGSRGGRSSLKSSFPGRSSDTGHDYHVPLQTTSVSSNLRSGIFESGRDLHPSSYSRLNAANLSSARMEDCSPGGGSYAGGDLNHHYSFSSLGDRPIPRLSDVKVQSSKDLQYDFTEPEARFRGSRNSEYEGYSGLGGYRIG